MKGFFGNRQTLLYFVSVMLLLAGLGSAIAIFLVAGTDADSESGYQVVGGYFIRACTNKTKSTSTT